MVRSMLTPSSDAIFRSCSQARMSRPSRVFATSQEKPTISTSVVSDDDDLDVGELRP